MSIKYINFLIAGLLVVLAISLRVLPHPPNFAPITAVAIFGGLTLPRRWAMWLPLGAMILSDAIIGFHDLILVTWGCYVLIGLVSSLITKRTFGRVALLILGSSLFFFVATNLAVWLQGELYPRTIVGLANCFIIALPFLRNTLMSDCLFTAALFGLYYLAQLQTANLKQKWSS